MDYEETTGIGGCKQEHEVLAMAYVPRQKWQNIYKYECGFKNGTIFAELDKPWYGSKRGGVCK